MDAIILSCGNELTSGQVVDTNSAWLSAELAQRGIGTLAHCTVGDDRAAIATAIAQAAARAGLVIMSGGLGPTEDDVSRHGLADAMGVELELHEQSLHRIEGYFARLGRQMNPTNRIQAMMPRGAEALPNEVGTAPGIAARVGGASVYIVPGVPREMRWIFQNIIAPRLPAGSGARLHRVIHTFGAGESDVGAAIADLMARDGNPLVGTTVSAGLVSVRVTTCAPDAATAQGMSSRVEDEICRRLGELVVGQDERMMAHVVGDLLRQRHATLATAESCTGGLVGEMLTAVAGSSDYYLGGVVSYSNKLKTDLLGVDQALIARHGAVSEPVAAAMAQGACRRLGSDWAVSITGIAGPGGGTAEKPVGLIYAGLCGPGVASVQRHIFPGDRATIRMRAALTALNALRLALLRK